MRSLVALLPLVLAACGSAPTPKPQPIGGTDPAKPVTVDATSWDKLEGPIQKLEIETTDPKLRAELEKVFAGELGQPIERARLRVALDEAMRNRAVAELAVRGVQIAGGIRLVIAVTPQPKLHAITARDSAGKPISLADMPNVPRPGSSLDARSLTSLVSELRDRYREQGYIAVDASWGTRPAGSGSVDVLIEVAPGEQVIVAKLEFTGTKQPVADLVRTAGKLLVLGEPLASDKLDRARVALAELYFDRGYPNVKIPLPSVSGPGRATITFAIEEGDRFKLGAIVVKGVEPKLAKRYERVATIKKGDVFSRSAIRDAANRVREAARQDGQPNAEVLPLTAVDPAAKTIGITFEVSNH